MTDLNEDQQFQDLDSFLNSPKSSKKDVVVEQADQKPATLILNKDLMEKPLERVLGSSVPEAVKSIEGLSYVPPPPSHQEAPKLEPKHTDITTDTSIGTGLVIYIGQLKPETNEETLRQFFEPFGKVVSVDIMHRPGTGECKGFAFLKFSSLEDGNRAICEMNEKEIKELSATKVIVKVSANQTVRRERRPFFQTQPTLQQQPFPTQYPPQMYKPYQMQQMPQQMLSPQNVGQPQMNPQMAQPMSQQQVPPKMYNPTSQPQPQQTQVQQQEYMQQGQYPMQYWPYMYMQGNQGKQKATLYIAHLPQNCTELTIYRNFARFGAIESANCLFEPNTTVCRGIAFVTYFDSQDAVRALQQMNNKMIDGQIIKVRFKNQK
ncbi:RNA-binding protein, putative [Entamoeba invadens IP1]|uniref:RNA-binding protein, putative n=1 Tax=Entamoeba invadens IP1 TaxID=370355 RepID=A0A0A1TWL2_ENTIV|nr:RNA-binding protein, putative [Entamoeba invadens IP1]ELP85594.1 RNA-binding protein, putative [Entamoeba invadens IP1]|eukprot:XP_004184940.1 RNA-binding protein, putative [Entamoeba invadens IP1]